ncbi:MAG: hypothetical protein PHH42_11865, partial [Bacteroidales bacterium]|nr:hypothetical protein [Bacteroidales bacterium]MDD4742651.1 hypothetical protein [Bacteroidales bacterium]
NLCVLFEKLRLLYGFSLFFNVETLRRRGKALNAFFVLIRLIRLNSWILFGCPLISANEANLR